MVIADSSVREPIQASLVGLIRRKKKIGWRKCDVPDELMLIADKHNTSNKDVLEMYLGLWPTIKI